MCCSLLEPKERMGSLLPKQSQVPLKCILSLAQSTQHYTALLPFTPTFFYDKCQRSASLPVLHVRPPQPGRQAQRKVSPWS